MKFSYNSVGVLIYKENLERPKKLSGGYLWEVKIDYRGRVLWS